MCFMPSKQELQRHIKKINENSAIGRSTNHKKLLEYLVNKEIERIDQESESVVPPKELEIAIDVFAKTADFNVAEDASVRVHISRLRKKLEEYYTNEGINETFAISIPVGEYRLVFIDKRKPNPSLNENTDIAATTKPSQSAVSLLNYFVDLRFSSAVFCKLVLAIALISLAVNIMLITKQPPQSLSVEQNWLHPLWQDYLHPKTRNLIVLGAKPAQLFNSVAAKERVYTKEQVNVHSKSQVMALKSVLTLSENFRNTRIIQANELTARDTKLFNIIYIGQFAEMGILKNYFKGSGLAYDEVEKTLTDVKHNKVYPQPERTHSQYIDYGVFAKFDGPSKGKVYIFSGFTDSALLWLTWFATSELDVNKLGHGKYLTEYDLPANDNVELFFRIPSMDGTDIGYELVSTSTVDNHAIWDLSESF
ncbi:hypothetical protein C2869_04045 [Saccharobesus litoralis]|uniref:Uncharacterized protein n=1 Tax=Saccharobesus litoralis TaxID=2172099 RepID=A0A2S0VN55_9ALTE|nr:helix-turn-helix domain-containing protein [Saccharobesus litoralis]AWB65658.1 hypothetical protein C2869_04045 [Saccharobesus litoralis]